MDLKPIFIVGAFRSGNTLMRMILTSHSQICIPPESSFLHYLEPVFRTGDANLKENILNKLFSDHKFSDWNLDKDEMAAYIDNSYSLPYPEFISGIYLMYLNKIGRNNAQWGDKNPLYVYIIKQLLIYYPKAYIIFLIREPLSIFGSLKRVRFFNLDREQMINEFFRRIKCVADSIQKYKDNHQVMFLSYADFVSSPEKHTLELLEKMNYTFESNMLRFYDNTELISSMLQDKVKYHENLFRPVTNSFIEAENYGLEPNEIALIERNLTIELKVIRNYIAIHSSK